MTTTTTTEAKNALKDSTVYVTPKMAKEFLKKSGNRNLYRKKIKTYVNEIMSGEWDRNIQKVSTQDINKMAAILESGETVRVYLRSPNPVTSTKIVSTGNTFKREEVLSSIEELEVEAELLKKNIEILKSKFN